MARKAGAATGIENEEACTRRAGADDGFTASDCGPSGTGFLNEAATGTAFASARLNGWVSGVFWEKCRPIAGQKRESKPAAMRGQAETEGDIVNCESVLGQIGSLYVSSYSPHSMRAIHDVPLGHAPLCPLGPRPSGLERFGVTVQRVQSKLDWLADWLFRCSGRLFSKIHRKSLDLSNLRLVNRMASLPP